MWAAPPPPPRQALSLGPAVTAFAFAPGPACPPAWAEATASLKLAARQSRRVYEILWRHRLGPAHANVDRAFVHAVKARLMQPFVKQKRRLERELRTLTEEERLVYAKQQQDTKAQVHREFIRLMDDYNRVIERLRDLR